MASERCAIWYRGRDHNKQYLLRIDALKQGDCVVEGNVGALCLLSSAFKIWCETSRGFEPRSLDSESRVLTVTPRDRLHRQLLGRIAFLFFFFFEKERILSLVSKMRGRSL